MKKKILALILAAVVFNTGIYYPADSYAYEGVDAVSAQMEDGTTGKNSEQASDHTETQDLQNPQEKDHQVLAQEQDAQDSSLNSDQQNQDGQESDDGSQIQPVSEEQVIPAEDFLKELLMHRGDCSFCTKLLQKDLFTKGKFPVGALNEDFHLLVKLLTDEENIVPGIACIPGQTYHVFYRPDSNTRDKNRFSRVFADNIDNADMVLRLVEARYPELTEIAFRFGVFQRLDYMLHIPIAQMTADNAFYRSVVKSLRKGWWRAMRNPYLTKKNKCYHTLFAIAPKGIRVLHKKLKHI